MILEKSYALIYELRDIQIVLRGINTCYLFARDVSPTKKFVFQKRSPGVYSQ